MPDYARKPPVWTPAHAAASRVATLLIIYQRLFRMVMRPDALDEERINRLLCAWMNQAAKVFTEDDITDPDTMRLAVRMVRDVVRERERAGGTRATKACRPSTRSRPRKAA
jgi:hypothetical protein